MNKLISRFRHFKRADHCVCNWCLGFVLIEFVTLVLVGFAFADFIFDLCTK